jgi:hypothetical protein
LSGAVAKPASINLRKLVLSPTSSINLSFILREDLLLCSSYLPLGVPNWVPNTHYQAIFLAPLPGRKRISARGVSRFQSFYFVIVLLIFFTLFLLASFYQKYKKFSSFIVFIFYLSAFSLARMSNPEIEVRTFKQQGGDFLHCDGDQAFNVIKKLIAVYSLPSDFDSSLVSIFARLNTLETHTACLKEGIFIFVPSGP